MTLTRLHLTASQTPRVRILTVRPPQALWPVFRLFSTGMLETTGLLWEPQAIHVNEHTSGQMSEFKYRSDGKYSYLFDVHFTPPQLLYVPPVYDIQQFYVPPAEYSYVILCIWAQRAIIPLYNITWLVFITEILPFRAQWLLYVLYHQFNIQQFYTLPTHCIYVFCVSQNKQRLFPYTAMTDWFL